MCKAKNEEFVKKYIESTLIAAFSVRNIRVRTLLTCFVIGFYGVR